MRTTLTLDEDVARAIEARRRTSGATFRAEVNDLLRAGLQAKEAPAERKPFQTRTLDLGAPLVPLDDLSQVLEDLDVEWWQEKERRSR